MTTSQSPMSNGQGAPRKRQQVAIIGLDGATFDLIQPWAEAGHLPNLKRLMDQGAWGRLASTEPPHSAPAWTTFATGKNPGKHGVYYFVQPTRDESRFRPVSSETIRARRIWQLASDEGVRVGVINVPMSYPMVPVNGYMIGDFFAPDERSAFDSQELYDEVVKNCGGYIVEAVLQPNPHKFLKEMLECIDQRAKVGSYLLETHPTDFFIFVFTLLDRAQHNFWADMDPEHPLHGNMPRDMIPDALLETHKHLDAGIGKMLEKLDPDALVIVMSDHGFRGEYNRFAVNNWLQDLGLINARTKAAYWFKTIGLQLKRMGLQKQIVAIYRKLQGTRRPEKLYYRSVNWKQTKVCYGPGQGFYINKKGRDHDGIVTDEEYEPLRDLIIQKLKEVRDPATGLPIVGEVYRREELYQGDALEMAPDIVPTNAEYVTEQGHRWGYGMTKFIGEPSLFVRPRELSGTHSPEGVFIAWGPQVKAGKLENLTIQDVAPTALHALGLAVPESMDGQVLTQIFQPEFVEANPVRYSDVDTSLSGREGQVLSDEHELIVEDRLKDLGYL